MTVQIHGKTYVTVAERLAMVHTANKSFEVTESQPIQCGEQWVWRCRITLDGKQYVGAAQVHLNARSGSADATDPFACAETSAVGRALAFAGILSADSIASADEMGEVQPQAEGTRAVTRSTTPAETLKTVMDHLKSAGVVSDAAQWLAWKKTVLGSDIPNNKLSGIQITKLHMQCLPRSVRKARHDEKCHLQVSDESSRTY